jgi:two-component sensor histidine kinase
MGGVWLMGAAVKHGALSNGTGHVHVEWECEVESGKVKLLWRESGGPLVEPPNRRGFGSRLTDNMPLSVELYTPKLDFNPDGLVCTLEIPIQR